MFKRAEVKGRSYGSCMRARRSCLVFPAKSALSCEENDRKMKQEEIEKDLII